MVYITGDTHIPIDIGKLNTKQFKEQNVMSRSDFLIVCGDFGAVWDNSKSDFYWRKWLDNKTFTTLFVDGNHENFHLLNRMPMVEFCGGTAHQVSSHIFHLMRGEIYEICGRKYFCMGGATSHDKMFRVKDKSWWSEELPTNEEFEHALNSLNSVGWEVDYVITHCAAKETQRDIASWYENDNLTSFLQIVKENCKYKHWYFGHYHIDKDIDDRHHALYDRIMKIGE